ncbi:hypothetical protein [Brevibacillus borstelensis]|uniref:hypothetical protein n=1 Tax=Brevibacillus borstelensis TaxID=45462 RepID=UPI0030C5B03B
MKRIKVTPTEDHRHYIHPDTKQEFPSGVVAETEADWFVKAKLNMGHLVEVKEEQVNDAPPAQNDEPAEALLSLEDFEKLGAADQIKNMGHLVEVKEEQVNDAPPAQNDEPAEALLSLEDFEKLGAADQIKKLVGLGLAVDEKDDAISNKEKRVALYNEFLNGADA